VTKTVVLLCVLCLLLVGASFGVIQALGRVAADLHRGALALDALVVRLADVERDLAVMSEDVASIADDVNVIAESLAVEEDGEAGEAVDVQRPAALRSAHRLGRGELVHRRELRLGRLAAIAARHLAHPLRIPPTPERPASH
jgi:hypothetical protein